MGIIYVLKKYVDGLGQITKVGMTLRSAQDRAVEYGGGGWEVVEEIVVTTNDVLSLRDLEGRIHSRLEQFRCTAAKGLGLTEVFTCTPDVAASAAREEVGGNADDDDKVERMRQRTKRAVERKIMQAHSADLARAHMGTYQHDHNTHRHTDIGHLNPIQIAEWQIHTKALKALDGIGADSQTFRAMLRGNIDALEERARHAALIAAQRQAERLAAQQSRNRQIEAAQRTHSDFKVQLERMNASRALQVRTADHFRFRKRLAFVATVIAFVFSLPVLTDGSRAWPLVIAVIILVTVIAASICFYVAERRCRARAASILDEWNRSHV